MKILSIGNSFSVDAQRYVLHFAKAGNNDIMLGNLYIGGCTLDRHCENMRSGLPAYEYFKNNESFGYASLLTGLKDEDWDYITLQQGSHFSGIWDTYEPHLSELAAYVKNICPKAELIIHETWAYEYNSTHGAFVNYNKDRNEMHACLHECYYKAAETLGVRLIPVGDAVQTARAIPLFDPEQGGTPLSRDGFHLGWRLGRYLAGAVWYEFFTGKDVRENDFTPVDMEYLGTVNGVIQQKPIAGSEPDAELLKLLKQVAHETVSSIRG